MGKPSDSSLRQNGWIRTPSVRAGGKAFFWYRRNPVTDNREWWLWDRRLNDWRHDVEEG